MVPSQNHMDLGTGPTGLIPATTKHNLHNPKNRIWRVLGQAGEERVPKGVLKAVEAGEEGNGGKVWVPPPRCQGEGEESFS